MYYLARAAITAIYLLVGLYVGYRWWQYFFTRFTFLSSRNYWILYILLVLSYPSAILLRPTIPESIYRLLAWTGLHFSALLFYLFVITAAIDLLGYSIPDLRKKRQLSGHQASAAAFILVLLLAFGRWNSNQIRMTPHKVFFPGRAQNTCGACRRPGNRRPDYRPRSPAG